MYYVHKQEKWSKAKCRKLARRTCRDGIGTPYPWPGYIGSHYDCRIRYNGGCEVGGKWYEGELYPLPIVPSEFKLIKVPYWGWRIVEA